MVEKYWVAELFLRNRYNSRMGLPGCLWEGLRRMTHPRECSPCRRDLRMLLKIWVFPSVRYSPLTQGPTPAVTLHKNDSLFHTSSFCACWDPHNQLVTYVVRWDVAQEQHLSKKSALHGVKVQAAFLQIDTCATKISGFWMKAQPKGL